MLRAIKEIGISQSLRYVYFTIILLFFKLMILSPLRVFFLRIAGASIGANAVLHNISFINLYRGSFKNLQIGKNCFIGDECLLDMADKIVIGDNVTLAERVLVLTHLNVGFGDHPLQKPFPSFHKPVTFKDGCFIGANSTILSGVTIGNGSMVGAASLVNKDIEPRTVCAGVPAKIIRKL